MRRDRSISRRAVPEQERGGVCFFAPRDPSLNVERTTAAGLPWASSAELCGPEQRAEALEHWRKFREITRNHVSGAFASQPPPHSRMVDRVKCACRVQVAADTGQKSRSSDLPLPPQVQRSWTAQCRPCSPAESFLSLSQPSSNEWALNVLPQMKITASGGGRGSIRGTRWREVRLRRLPDRRSSGKRSVSAAR
jgi:hypothetical protein